MCSASPFRLIARLIIMNSFGFIVTSLWSLKLRLVEASCSMQVSCFLGAGTHFFFGCEGPFVRFPGSIFFSEVKFVDFPAALGSYRFALTDIWYRCTARGPFKTHTIFFRESSS